MAKVYYRVKAADGAVTEAELKRMGDCPEFAQATDWSGKKHGLMGPGGKAKNVFG